MAPSQAIQAATDEDLVALIRDATASLPETLRAELGDLATATGGAVH